MTALQDRRARLLASLYRTYGEAATWTPAAGGAGSPVTIRRAPEDVEQAFGDNLALVRKDFIRVRVSEVSSPGKGDLVVIGSESFRILGKPRKVKAGNEWVCEPGPDRTP